MGNCLVTKLKGVVNDGTLRKLGELRLKAVSNGTLTLRPYYDAITVAVLSGTVTYNGSTVTEPVDIAKDTTNNKEFGVTADAVVAIYNKYGLDILLAPTMELTDGDKLESLYYSKFYQINLGGDTAGSIDGLNTERLETLYLNNTKATGSIDIFADSSAIRNLRVRTTQIGGHLSSLTGKPLVSGCLFSNSNIYVDVADIASMSSGNDLVSKYANCYLYGDVSSLPATDDYIGSQNADKVMEFTWLTERHNVSGAYIITNAAAVGTRFINYGTYLDAMLVDQAQCTKSSTTSPKGIKVYGTHTPNSDWESAVATLKSKGITVVINDVTQ